MDKENTICVRCKHLNYKRAYPDRSPVCMANSKPNLDRDFVNGRKVLSWTYKKVDRNDGDCPDYKKLRFWQRTKSISDFVTLVEEKEEPKAKTSGMYI